MNGAKRFSLTIVESGLGPTLTFIVAGLLWLIYLAPGLRTRHEEKTLERNARRIALTSESIGVRSATPLREMTTQEIIIHRRELERLARTAERQSRRADERELRVRAPAISARRRLARLTFSLVTFVAAAVAVVYGLSGDWPFVALSTGLSLLGVIALIAVNTAPLPVATTTTAPPRQRVEPEPKPTWTPVRVPPVHHAMPDGAGLIVSDEVTKAIAARERAERIRLQAELAARVEGRAALTPDPRFTEPTPPATDEMAPNTIDINAALRARRAN